MPSTRKAQRDTSRTRASRRAKHGDDFYDRMSIHDAVKKFRGRLLEFVHSAFGSIDAEDVVQQAFTEAILAGEAGGGVSHALLRTIVWRRGRDVARKERRADARIPDQWCVVAGPEEDG